MLLMLKLTLLEKNNLRMLHRSMAFITLLLSFALGAKAEVYYIIYYDDTSTNPATRHYVSINGSKVEDATTFSERCIWMNSMDLSNALGGGSKLEANSEEDIANRANRTNLRSWSSSGKYLGTNNISQNESDKGTAKALKVLSSSNDGKRWLAGVVEGQSDNHLVCYTYYYNQYVYYDNGWKISSKADDEQKDKLAVIEKLPSSGLYFNIASVENEKVTISLTSEYQGDIYYTTDGTTPNKSSTKYSNPFDVDLGTVVKAVYTYKGLVLPFVFEKRIPKKLVVEMDDRESHSWCYYQENKPISSPNPRDVKITYDGGGIINAGLGNARAAVGIDAPETSLVYNITLESKQIGETYTYPYTTIANPFSMRPSRKDSEEAAKQFYGFAGWKISDEPSGCTLVNSEGNPYEKGDVIPAETEIFFQFVGDPIDNLNIPEVKLEAEWEESEVVYVDSPTEISNAIANDVFNDGTYETNFIVVKSAVMMTSNINNTKQKSVTIMMVEPDGSVDYRTKGYIEGDGNKGISLNETLKLEYINISGLSYINANFHNLILGRGIKAKDGRFCATNIRGQKTNTTFTKNFNYKLRIESGVYQSLYFLTTGGTFSGDIKNIRAILGCDYDRSTNNNDLLKITNTIAMGSGTVYSGKIFADATFVVTTKSGKFNSEQPTGNGSSTYSFYVSLHSNPTNVGQRTLIVEGGEFCNIAGGVDTNNNLSSNADNSTDILSLYIRMKGGYVRGSIYGAGAYAQAHGNRKIVITGGTIKGWVAAGCNGTSDESSGGTLNGNTYVYIGGDAVIGNTDGSQPITVNTSQGGNIFGAGSGNSNQPETGRVLNSTVVIADNAFVQQNVYGGGNYGYTQGTADVHILGGTIGGNVYGGSNQKGGTGVLLTMKGGTVKGDIYGGSNITGTIKNDVAISIHNGTINGNIFGGGNEAPVKGNTNVTITGGTVNKNVYGGGNKAEVSGTTNVVIGKQ